MAVLAPCPATPSGVWWEGLVMCCCFFPYTSVRGNSGWKCCQALKTLRMGEGCDSTRAYLKATKIYRRYSLFLLYAAFSRAEKIFYVWPKSSGLALAIHSFFLISDKSGVFKNSCQYVHSIL